MSLLHKSWAAAPQAAGLRPAAWGAIADHATDHRRPWTNRPGASHGIQLEITVTVRVRVVKLVREREELGTVIKTIGSRSFMCGGQ